MHLSIYKTKYIAKNCKKNNPNLVPVKSMATPFGQNGLTVTVAVTIY